MQLSEVKQGESAIIVKVNGHGGFRRRIMEMGFVRGQQVDVEQNAPLDDPIKYKIMGYEVSLRRAEASMINVITIEEAKQEIEQHDTPTTINDSEIKAVVESHSKCINIALVGNPNSGKTTLFNTLCGSREHVGNYSGVTVDAKLGRCKYKGYKLYITDLPGTYALSAYTPEERYVRHHIAKNTPDVIINAVVASNLERNLYLTSELLDMNLKSIVALNMYDELEKSGAELNYNKLGSMLGVPMIPTTTRSGRGITELLDTIIDVYENRDSRVRHIHINNGQIIERGLNRLKDTIKESSDELPVNFPPRYYAIKLLERDKDVEHALKRQCPSYPTWEKVRNTESQHIERDLNEDLESAITSQKYGFISGALKETLTEGKTDTIQATRIIDTIVTHKLWGFPIFMLLMFLMFYCTFSLGEYPQMLIEYIVETLGVFVETVMPDGALRDLIIDGIIGGIGGVIVFLPNIMILYLFISFMEDSGYLSRAAFIMDKIMHRIGLHGKSFIPLIMGFGCNVPAIMASRTIESRSSRIITIMITPFISCSARLPIYILLIGTFFPQYAGITLFLVFFGGILIAALTAIVMRKFIFKKDETPFVMELPPYRVPSLKTTLSHMWDKCKEYLQKMGKLILLASIIVWFLSYFPRPISEEHHSTETGIEQNSYLEQIGVFCEPIMKPIGMSWQTSVAALSGISAKEIVVSTLSVLYAEERTEGVDNDESTLSARLIRSGDFTTASALAFLIFSLLYFPCVATLAAIKNEAGWKWATASVTYSTVLAWVLAFVAYQIALLI